LAARPVLALRARDAKPGDQGWQVFDSARVSRNDPRASILLPDRSVSHRHASINMVNGEFMLVDDGSKNGTFVNGRKIVRPTALNDGDQLSFGDVILLAEVRRPTPQTPPMADAGRTVLYGGGEAPAVREPRAIRERPAVIKPPVVIEPARRQRAAPPDDATVIEGGRRAAVDTSSAPAPIVERDQAPTGQLADLVAESQALSNALREFQQDVTAAMIQFDQSGGRQTLKAVLERLRRIESGRDGNRDLEALTNWLPTVRSLLEAELSLIDVVAPLASGSGGQPPRDKLQSHAAYFDRLPEAY
jgi:predicted component of type VI protein secretion system